MIRLYVMAVAWYIPFLFAFPFRSILFYSEMQPPALSSTKMPP